MLTTPYLIDLIAPGFEGAKRELTIRLVKIFFPGAGLLVLSALSRRTQQPSQIFLSYTAPVIWNLAIIGALVGFGERLISFDLRARGLGFGWGQCASVCRSTPTVLRLLKRLRPVFDVTTTAVRHVVRNFFPVFFSRGVVQISAFVDAWLASWLGTGAVGALSYTQSIYTLPVSLFGMAVSAAELPAMASAIGTRDEVAVILRRRLDAGLQRIAFFIVPSAMAFLTLGDVMAGALYQTGEFKRDAALYVWGILAGSSIGLLASTLGRLYSSTYYALRDTRTPLIYAIIHVGLATILGYFAALPLPRYLGIEPWWGVVGLTLSASIAAWVELLLLRRTLNARIGRTGLPGSYLAKLWLSALISAGVGWALKWLLFSLHPIPMAAIVLGCYGVTYFGVTYFLNILEARLVIDRIIRRFRPRK